MLSLHLDRSLYARTAHLSALAHCGDLTAAYHAYRGLMRACTPQARTTQNKQNNRQQQAQQPQQQQEQPNNNNTTTTDNNTTIADNITIDPLFVSTRQHVPLPAVASLLHTCYLQKHGLLGLTVFTEYCHRAGTNKSYSHTPHLFLLRPPPFPLPPPSLPTPYFIYYYLSPCPYFLLCLFFRYRCQCKYRGLALVCKRFATHSSRSPLSFRLCSTVDITTTTTATITITITTTTTTATTTTTTGNRATTITITSIITTPPPKNPFTWS